MRYGEITAENLDRCRPGRDLPARSRRSGQHRVLGRRVKVRDGEAVFEAAQKLFFDPFRPSIMLDSDGSNTTAAAAVARVRGAATLKGSRAAVIGVGPVGLRTAELLRREGAEVTHVHLPARRHGGWPSPRVGDPRRAGGRVRGRRAVVERRARRCAGRSRRRLRRRTGGYADPAPQRLGPGGGARGRRLFGGRARRGRGRRPRATISRRRTASSSSERWRWAARR